ncbi:MAG: hypothetical protein ACJ8C3_04770, partial [Microvirga sp.]
GTPLPNGLGRSHICGPNRSLLPRVGSTDSAEGMRSVLEMLKALDPEMQNANVDLGKTFDDRFVRKSPVR